MRWVEIASIASVAWAIAGSNAGMHLAVALAISAYRACLEGHAADDSECQVILHRDWATHSGKRLSLFAEAVLEDQSLKSLWQESYRLSAPTEPYRGSSH